MHQYIRTSELFHSNKTSCDFFSKPYVTALYPTADEAARARELLAASLRKNRPPENRGKITVAEFILIYLEDLYLRAAAPNGPRQSTLAAYESTLRNRIVPVIGGIKLKNLSVRDINQLFSTMQATHSHNYARSAVSIFKKVLRLAYRWRYLEEDLSTQFITPRKKWLKPEILTPEQLETLLSAADSKTRAIIGLAAFGGFRRGEIFGLKWADIDFHGSLIHITRQYHRHTVCEPKTEKGARAVPILPELKPILQEWKLQCGSPEWVFPGNEKMPICDGDWWYLSRIVPLLKELQLPRVTLHSFRHLCDKMLHDRGVPTREVMQILGHTSAVMTLDVYDRGSDERLVEVTRGIRFFSSGFVRNSLRNSGTE